MAHLSILSLVDKSMLTHSVWLVYLKPSCSSVPLEFLPPSLLVLILFILNYKQKQRWLINVVFAHLKCQHHPLIQESCSYCYSC